MVGLNTYLVIHGQDQTADYLLNYKIETSCVQCNNSLYAVRLKTTKMFLEPLNNLKQADAQLNMTQGILGGETVMCQLDDFQITGTLNGRRNHMTENIETHVEAQAMVLSGVEVLVESDKGIKCSHFPSF